MVIRQPPFAVMAVGEQPPLAVDRYREMYVYLYDMPYFVYKCSSLFGGAAATRTNTLIWNDQWWEQMMWSGPGPETQNSTAITKHIAAADV